MRTGIWLVGARGYVSTATVMGWQLLQRQQIDPIGLISATEHFKNIDFAKWEQFTFGGIDLSSVPLSVTAQSLVNEKVIPADHLRSLEKDLEDCNKQIQTLKSDCLTEEAGFLVPIFERAYEGIVDHISKFAHTKNLDRIIVVNLASTERVPADSGFADYMELDDLIEACRNGHVTPTWGMVYAIAALKAGCAFVNFTPNIGTELISLQNYAIHKRIPHVGKDGKTGETLLKTVLAPLFVMRNLRVLAWEGHNILGNNDGRTLSDPRARLSKTKSKELQLRNLLKGNGDFHAGVSIDYVPAFGDWKTAWDYIDFSGFFDSRMSLQLLWRGSDTALAAPLVLDLVRFVELGWRRGEYGHLAYLNSYFKSPTNASDHDFRSQVNTLYSHFGFTLT